MKKILFFAALSLSVSAVAADKKTVDLTKEMDSLDLQDTSVPESVAREKLYAIQTRANPLGLRNELDVTMGRTVVGDGFLVSQQLGLGYQFHITDRWSLGAGASWFFNSFNDTARALVNTRNLYPVISYIRQAYEANATFRTFYGKIRFTMANVLHFDQYLTLGGASLNLNNNIKRGALAWDAGLNFWIGRNTSARLGLKDYVYKDTPQFKSAWTQNLQAHFDLGFVL